MTPGIQHHLDALADPATIHRTAARKHVTAVMGRPLHDEHLIPLMEAAVAETLDRDPKIKPTVITSIYAHFHTTASPAKVLDLYESMVLDLSARAMQKWALHEIYDRVTKMGRVVSHTDDGFPVVDCSVCHARHDARLDHRD